MSSHSLIETTNATYLDDHGSELQRAIQEQGEQPANKNAGAGAFARSQSAEQILPLAILGFACFQLRKRAAASPSQRGALAAVMCAAT